MTNPLLEALDLAKKTVSLAQTQSHEPNPELDKLGQQIDQLEKETPLAAHLPQILAIAQEALKDEILWEHLQNQLDLKHQEVLDIKTHLETYLRK
jgi:DNA mismatch repair ATPase MutL